MKISFIVASILGLCLISKATGSAIPIWESLSKGEKMSRLFDRFKLQAENYCIHSTSPDCNKNLMLTASQKLNNLSNDQMDFLDPYQRNSEEMIWQALTEGVKGNVDDVDERFSVTSTVYTEGENGLAEESSPIANFIQPANRPGPFVVGPMVSRVLPDGRPVPGDESFPKDDDLEDLRFSRLPSIEEIETKTNSRFYKKPERYSLNTLVSPYHDQRPRYFIRNRRNNYPLREPIFFTFPFDLRYY